MDPQAAPPAPVRRPAYWLATLLAMWLVGVNAAQEGYGAIELLRDPLTGNFSGTEAARSALVNALGQHSRVELPLAVAQLLLGGLLVFIATHLFFGGRPSRAFALQVLAANLLFLVLGYFLREATRVSYIAALLESSEDPSALSKEFWWRSRFVLGFDLVALTLSFFALTRSSSRQFLELRTEPDAE
jgi:hypothetical protein